MLKGCSGKGNGQGKGNCLVVTVVKNIRSEDDAIQSMKEMEALIDNWIQEIHSPDLNELREYCSITFTPFVLCWRESKVITCP